MMRSDDELLDVGCSCHLSPPCGLCTKMDEDETQAYIDGGLRGLKAHIRQREEREEDEHSRCVGCGSMDEELLGPCVTYGVLHSTVSVDADGQLPSLPVRHIDTSALIDCIARRVIAEWISTCFSDGWELEELLKNDFGIHNESGVDAVRTRMKAIISEFALTEVPRA